jgi:hypothetical protein
MQVRMGWLMGRGEGGVEEGRLHSEAPGRYLRCLEVGRVRRRRRWRQSRRWRCGTVGVLHGCCYQTSRSGSVVFLDQLGLA